MLKTSLFVLLILAIANAALVQQQLEDERSVLKRSLDQLLEANDDESSAYLKRHLVRILERLDKREEENEEAADETPNETPDETPDYSSNTDNDNDNDQTVGEGIFIPTGGGGRINICTQQYISIAGEFHPQMKELMKTACQGSQSAKWLVKSIAKYIFNKQPKS